MICDHGYPWVIGVPPELERILAVCADLGVPLAMDKLEGQAQCLTFLGIELDTQAGVMRLPADKLSRLKDLLAHWFLRKSCRRQQLESLIGTLRVGLCNPGERSSGGQ